MKDKKFTLLLIAVFLVLVAVSFIILNFSEKIKVENFEDCVKAGNPVMESYPRQCQHKGMTYIEDLSGEKIYCTEEQRNSKICNFIYQPVCGPVQIQYITEPCDPKLQTFSNSCFACSNSLVKYYTNGECNNE
jgi:hypothetical protein